MQQLPGARQERTNKRSAHPNMRAMLGWSVGKSRLNDRRPPTARLSQACTSKTVYNQLPAHPDPRLPRPQPSGSLKLTRSVVHATSPPQLGNYSSIPHSSVCLLHLLICHLQKTTAPRIAPQALVQAPLGQKLCPQKYAKDNNMVRSWLSR